MVCKVIKHRIGRVSASEAFTIEENKLVEGAISYVAGQISFVQGFATHPVPIKLTIRFYDTFAVAIVCVCYARGDSDRWIFGLCSIVFGLAHLTDVAEDVIYVPKWMPLGGEFWVIVTGICFVLAGIAILSGILDVLAARLLALMLFVFSAVRLLPVIFVFLHRHDVWGGNAYNLAAVAAAWILADSIASRHREREHAAKAQLAEVS
jgi:uncharacterized membrane protein